MNWRRVLTSLARRVNPLLKDLLAGMDYCWITDQAEYATDVVFKRPMHGASTRLRPCMATG